MPTVVIPKAVSDGTTMIMGYLGFSSWTAQPKNPQAPTTEQIAAVEARERETWMHRLQGAAGYAAVTAAAGGDIKMLMMYYAIWRFSEQTTDFVYANRKQIASQAKVILQPVLQQAKKIIDVATTEESQETASPEKPAVRNAM